jgi:hypothetical protein
MCNFISLKNVLFTICVMMSSGQTVLASAMTVFAGESGLYDPVITVAPGSSFNVDFYANSPVDLFSFGVGVHIDNGGLVANSVTGATPTPWDSIFIKTNAPTFLDVYGDINPNPSKPVVGAGSAIHLFTAKFTASSTPGTVFNITYGDSFNPFIDGGTFKQIVADFANSPTTRIQVESAIPLPAAFWLFLSGMAGLFKYARQSNRDR